MKSLDVCNLCNLMYIRIEFEDLNSEKTKDTQYLFFGSPSGTILSSKNAQRVSSTASREARGNSVAFWYIDVDVANKHYGGARGCLNGLARYPGVASVDILPIEGHPSKFVENYTELDSLLMKYIEGVN